MWLLKIAFEDKKRILESCEKALAANPNNPRALYHLAIVSNKTNESEKAVEYAKTALLHEKEVILMSAINFELGSAYQSTKQYDEACEALQKVTEEPFLTRAEKKIEIVGCN